MYGALNLTMGRELVMHALRLNAATTAQYREQILSAYPDGPLVVL